MKKSKVGKNLHFREVQLGRPVSVDREKAVVDINPNHKLIRQILDGQEAQEGEKIMCVHWECTGRHFSTVTVTTRAEKDYFLVLTSFCRTCTNTMGSIRTFTNDMWQTFTAQLLYISPQPLSFVFAHPSEGSLRIRDKMSLQRIFDKLLCVKKENLPPVNISRSVLKDPVQLCSQSYTCITERKTGTRRCTSFEDRFQSNEFGLKEKKSGNYYTDSNKKETKQEDAHEHEAILELEASRNDLSSAPNSEQEASRNDLSSAPNSELEASRNDLSSAPNSEQEASRNDLSSAPNSELEASRNDSSSAPNSELEPSIDHLSLTIMSVEQSPQVDDRVIRVLAEPVTDRRDRDVDYEVKTSSGCVSEVSEGSGTDVDYQVKTSSGCVSEVSEGSSTHQSLKGEVSWRTPEQRKNDGVVKVEETAKASFAQSQGLSLSDKELWSVLDPAAPTKATFMPETVSSMRQHTSAIQATGFKTSRRVGSVTQENYLGGLHRSVEGFRSTHRELGLSGDELDRFADSFPRPISPVTGTSAESFQTQAKQVRDIHLRVIDERPPLQSTERRSSFTEPKMLLPSTLPSSSSHVIPSSHSNSAALAHSSAHSLTSTTVTSGLSKASTLPPVLPASPSTFSRTPLDDCLPDDITDDILAATTQRADRAPSSVLCIDNSDSISEEDFLLMKKRAIDFIDGIDANTENSIEENIGLVTFGRIPKVHCYLTNDYGSLRDAIEDLPRGGCSPLLDGINFCFVCLQKSRGSGVHVKGELRVGPRIIIMTDGFVTRNDGPAAPDSREIVEMPRLSVVSSLSKISGQMKKDNVSDSMVWIPVGNADKDFIHSLSVISNGKIIDLEDLPDESQYQQVMHTSASILGCLESLKVDEVATEAMIDGLCSSLSEKGKSQVKKIIEENVKGSSVVEWSIDDFDNINQEPDLPPLGSRVIRGPDWNYDNQDGWGPGTVINHSKNMRHVWVHWDVGRHNRYGCSAETGYDVLAVDDQPRLLLDDEYIGIGSLVERGAHWNEDWKDDNGVSGVGTVIRRRGGKIMVRWESGYIGKYRFGEDGFYDVSIRSPFEDVKPQVEFLTCADTPVQEQKDPAEENLQNDQYVWQRMVDREWKSYHRDIDSKLKADFNKKLKTCLIQDGQTQFRISFKDMTARCVATTKSVPVRRLRLTRK